MELRPGDRLTITYGRRDLAVEYLGRVHRSARRVAFRLVEGPDAGQLVVGAPEGISRRATREDRRRAKRLGPEPR